MQFLYESKPMIIQPKPIMCMSDDTKEYLEILEESKSRLDFEVMFYSAVRRNYIDKMMESEKKWMK